MKKFAFYLFLFLCAKSGFAGTPETAVTCDISHSPADVEVVSGAWTGTSSQSRDLQHYLKKNIEKVRKNWYRVIPASARSPQLKRGCAVIQFKVAANGLIGDLRMKESSGEDDLDLAAWQGVDRSNPLQRFPKQVKEKEIVLRVRFLYNPNTNEARQSKP
jgi:TonB family protein